VVAEFGEELATLERPLDGMEHQVTMDEIDSTLSSGRDSGV
jgi:hypothetical protein